MRPDEHYSWKVLSRDAAGMIRQCCFVLMYGLMAASSRDALHPHRPISAPLPLQVSFLTTAGLSSGIERPSGENLLPREDLFVIPLLLVEGTGGTTGAMNFLLRYGCLGFTA